jgi:hypothetical protein
MYTSLLLVALSGMVPAAGLDAPSWQADYGAARKQGTTQEKPLAVFVGSGQAGWNQLDQDGRLSARAKRLLASDYVCVYVDTQTEAGRHLADELEISNGLGMVLSDRSGKVQAFRHEGDLADATLVSYLERFSDPNLVVKTTVTNPAPQRSYAPAANYCPTCGGGCPTCGGGRR